MKTLAMLAAMAALSTSAAAAADLGVVNTSVPATYIEPAGFDWTGLYAGVNGGFARANYDDADGATIVEPEGLFGGIQAGYNFALNGLVIGIEGDLQLADVEGDLGFAPPVEGYLSIDHFATVRARAGLAVDRALPYVTGGFAYARGAFRLENNGMSLESEDDFLGFTVGAGVEYAVTDNITVKGEYLYMDLGTAELENTEVDLQAHVVRAGLNFKF